MIVEDDADAVKGLFLEDEGWGLEPKGPLAALIIVVSRSSFALRDM